MTDKLNPEFNGDKTDIIALCRWMRSEDSRQDSFETFASNLMLVLAGLAEDSIQIKKQLAKLDALDGIKETIAAFTAALIASRDERALAGKSPYNQQPS